MGWIAVLKECPFGVNGTAVPTLRINRPVF